MTALLVIAEILNIPKSMRLSKEARDAENFTAEYHWGAMAIFGGMLWGAILGICFGSLIVLYLSGN